jgi:hemerythrin-like domain-containing protein
MSAFLKAPAPGFDDPLGLLGACHGRIIERLDTLERLPPHLRRHGPDAQAQLAARRILEYFDRAAPHHHADEDRDFFPLLAAAEGRAGWDEGVPDLIARLAGEHPLLEQGWQALRASLEEVAGGRADAIGDAAGWIAATRAHLALEEERILPLAARVLTPGELEALGRAMAARRGVDMSLG